MARKKVKKEGEEPVIAAAPIELQRLEPLSADLLRDAEAWAIECGLSAPFLFTGPERIEFPRFGHGYTVLIAEQNAPGRGRKTRMGTARFNDRGERAMWSLDGAVVL